MAGAAKDRSIEEEFGVAQASWSTNYNSRSEGFSDSDLEKPRFGHRPHGPKVALLLSKDGERPAVQVPATINQHLRDYQRDGIRFLYHHYQKGEGALLGDDMGLGKTVQVIGFISAVLGKTGTQQDIRRMRPKFIRALSSGAGMEDDEDEVKKVFLVIGPATVMYNWLDELETWGHFNIGKFHKNHKSQTLSDLKKEKLDVVLTTFETCRDNIDALNQFEWTAIIADEAHKIKGWKAEATRALKQLKCRRRFALTGTALQNTLLELWCVLDWCNPGCLGNAKEFENQYDRMIKKGQKHDATKRELAEARKAKEKLAKLRAKWMIRRTKQLIADELPSKEEKVVYCQPTSLQLSIYKAILAHPDMRLVLTQNTPCSCDSGQKRGKCCYTRTRDGTKISTVTMTFMHLLMKAANHIALLVPDNTPSEEQQKKGTEICQVAFKAHAEFLALTRESSFHALSNPKYCGKMKVLAGLLSVFKKERSRVLIFSLSTQLLTILEQYVISVGYEYRRLDGKTPSIQRTQLVREFNKDPDIFLFLASTRAGGIGLNLTGANVVVIYDPNWNPSHDLQAQDRAYRIGQGRDVRVYRLICSGTIEENVYLRQVYKQQLDNVAVEDKNAKRLFYGVQGDKFNQGELFGIENMFALRASDKSLTADVLERNDKVEKGLKGFYIKDYVPPPSKKKHTSGKEDETDDLSLSGDSECETEAGPESDADIQNAEDAEEKCGTLTRKASNRNKPADVYGLNLFLQQNVPDLTAEDEADDDSDGASTERRQDGVSARRSAKEDTTDVSYMDKTTDSSPVPSTSAASDLRSKRRSSGRYEQSSSGWKRHSPRKSSSKYGEEIEDFSDENSPKKLDKRDAKRTKPVNRNVFQEQIALPEPSIQYSFDSVSDAFRNCGVVHTHANHEMIANSKVEDHISRCAIQDVFELHQNTQDPAIQCDQLEESSDESDDVGEVHRDTAAKKKKKVSKTDSNCSAQKRPRVKKATQPKWNKPRAEVVNGCKVLIGQTPKAIRQSQMELIAAFLKSDSVVEAAEKIVEATVEQRYQILKDFYINQDEKLSAVFESPDAEQESAEAEKTSRGRAKSGKRTQSGSRSTSRGRPCGARSPPKRSPRKTRRTQRGLDYDDSTDAEDDSSPVNKKMSEGKLANEALTGNDPTEIDRERSPSDSEAAYTGDTQIYAGGKDSGQGKESSPKPAVKRQSTLVNDMDDFLNFMTMPSGDGHHQNLSPPRRKRDKYQNRDHDGAGVQVKPSPLSPERTRRTIQNPVPSPSHDSSSVIPSQTLILEPQQTGVSHADEISEQSKHAARKTQIKQTAHKQPSADKSPEAGQAYSDIVDELLSDTVVKKKAPPKRRYRSTKQDAHCDKASGGVLITDRSDPKTVAQQVTQQKSNPRKDSGTSPPADTDSEAINDLLDDFFGEDVRWKRHKKTS